MAKDPKQISETFVADLREIWGEALDAVILYGSAVRDDYRPGQSDLNFLVLVKELAPEQLIAAGKYWKRWRKQNISLPLFMRPEMITTALDSYPLEFMAMKAAYKISFGSDPLAEIEFAREDVRLQCERELRGKILHLRAGLVDSEGKKDRMAALIRQSLPAMLAIFQGLLFLAGRKPGVWGNDLLAVGRDAFDLDDALFHELLRIRMEKGTPDKDTLANQLVRYIKEVERLVDWVDAGGLAGEK